MFQYLQADGDISCLLESGMLMIYVQFLMLWVQQVLTKGAVVSSNVCPVINSAQITKCIYERTDVIYNN